MTSNNWCHQIAITNLNRIVKVCSFLSSASWLHVVYLTKYAFFAVYANSKVYKIHSPYKKHLNTQGFCFYITFSEYD